MICMKNRGLYNTMSYGNIYVVIQGPYSLHIQDMLSQLKDLSNIRYCVSTYKNIYKKKIEDLNVIYSDPLILPNNKFINNIKQYKGEGIYCQQIYSTFIGLYTLKQKYDIQENDIVIKCRTDEYFNLEKFLSFIKNDKVLYNVDWVYDENSMSDHLFCCNFNLMYKSYCDMINILITAAEDTENVFNPLQKIETVIWRYLSKYKNNLKKVPININNLFPCKFVRNNAGIVCILNDKGKDISINHLEIISSSNSQKEKVKNLEVYNKFFDTRKVVQPFSEENMLKTYGDN